jgi:predicted dehydrogenase
METEDTAVAALRYRTGALGLIYGTTASYPGQFRRFEITGTRGTVINVENSITVWQFADEKPEDERIRRQFMKIEGGGGVADPAAITHENHTRNFRAFLDALEKKDDFWISGPEARKAVEVILAIYQSAQEGRLIRLR